MTEGYWFITGILLVGIVLASTLLRRLPISTSIIYLDVPPLRTFVSLPVRCLQQKKGLGCTNSISGQQGAEAQLG